MNYNGTHTITKSIELELLLFNYHRNNSKVKILINITPHFLSAIMKQRMDNFYFIACSKKAITCERYCVVLLDLCFNSLWKPPDVIGCLKLVEIKLIFNLPIASTRINTLAVSHHKRENQLRVLFLLESNFSEKLHPAKFESLFSRYAVGRSYIWNDSLQ